MAHRAFWSVVALLGAGAGVSHGAIVSPPIDFDVEADYTNNFLDTSDNVSYFSGTQNIGITGDNLIAITRYDTDRTNDGTLPGTPGPADFLTETLSLDTTFSALNNSSIGLITRIRTADNLGVLGLVNATSATAIQIRLFYDTPTAVPAPGGGTVFYEGTFNLSNGTLTSATGNASGSAGSTNQIAANSPLTLTLTQAAGSDPVFNLTVSDAQGLVASSGNRTLTATENYNNPGSVAIRFFAANIEGTTTITAENFSAVPEPAGGAVVAGALALAAGAGRRHRRA